MALLLADDGSAFTAIGPVRVGPVRLTLDGASYDLHDRCDLAVRSDGRLYVISFSAALNRRELFTLDPDTGAPTLR